jgi:hypothetical protein
MAYVTFIADADVFVNVSLILAVAPLFVEGVMPVIAARAQVYVVPAVALVAV